jgi:hypothetical protein
MFVFSAVAQQDAPSIGFVRFAHTAVDVGPLDFYEDGADVPIVTGLEYGGYSPLYTLPVSGRALTARAAGSPPDGEVLFTLGQGVVGNYTALVVAAGEAETLSFIIEPLNIIRSEINGAARIRTVSFVRGNDTLDVRLGADNVIAADIGYIGLTDVEIEPTTADVSVIGPDGSVLYQQAGQVFEPDMHYTIVLYGDSASLATVSAMIIATPQETTRVQLVNNADRAVDVYLRGADETLFLADLQPGTTTDFVSLPSRAYTFIIQDAGSGPDGQERGAVAHQFRPARDVVLAISGSDPLAFNLVSEVLTPADVNDALNNPPMTEADATAEATPAA